MDDKTIIEILNRTYIDTIIAMLSDVKIMKVTPSLF